MNNGQAMGHGLRVVVLSGDRTRYPIFSNLVTLVFGQLPGLEEAVNAEVRIVRESGGTVASRMVEPVKAAELVRAEVVRRAGEVDAVAADGLDWQRLLDDAAAGLAS